MRITAIIDRGVVGFYSVRSEEKVGRYFFGGYGESVKAAKSDFQASVTESLDEARKEGSSVPGTVDVIFKYDIPSFFNYFDFLNVSKFADFAGVNESKMRAYKCGAAYPGEKTTRKIMKALDCITRDLRSTIL